MKKTALFAALLCLAQSSLHAVVPQFLNYQGNVFDSTGLPLGSTGSGATLASSPINRKIIFRIYATATGGNTLWTEEQTATIALGEFSVVLGTGAQVSGLAAGLGLPIPAIGSEQAKKDPAVPLSSVFADGAYGTTGADRYLEIVVEDGSGTFDANDKPITPRQQITSTGFAFQARYADELNSSANMTVNTSTGALTAKAITGTSVAVTGGGTISGVHVGNGAQLTALAGANITADSVPLGALVAAVQQALCPPGTVVAYMGLATAVPAGWLLCDGKSYSRNAPYDKLYAVIGSASGSADTANFNVPDLRGMFLRGVDGNAGRDLDSGTRTALIPGGNAGNQVGSFQADAFKSHTHTENQTQYGGTGTQSGGFNWPNYTSLTNTGTTGGKETRPINTYVNYIIKL
jgi:microcystin-dependent protein